MKNWHGHHAATIAVLTDLHARSVCGSTVISDEELTLHVVSEFWAAVHNRTLSDYLSYAAGIRLLVAERAFFRVGAARVGGTLQLVRIRLAAAQPLLSIEELAPILESKLVVIDERVDSLIARFAASKCLGGKNWSTEILKFA